MHIPQSGWGDSEIRRFGKAAVEALCQSLGVKPELTQAHMAELNRHHSNPVMAERVRRPLEDRLREAWDRDCRVILIAHSLGAAIAYDALWRFTHRRDPDLQRYRRRKVDLLVTMGSPLGDPRMWNVMLCKCWLESRHAATATERRRAWPHNIARWHNYSALGDLVCHDLDMEALFFEPMRRDLPDYRRDDFRDYRALFNPYRESGGDPNPHKGLGYLIQPKLASQLCRFISTVDSG